MTHRLCPHCGGKLDEKKTIEWGGWHYDETSCVLTVGGKGKSVRFTNQQGAIIGTLLRGQGRLCRRDGEIYSIFCEGKSDAEWPNVKIIDVQISKAKARMIAAGFESRSISGMHYMQGPLIACSWGQGWYAMPYMEGGAIGGNTSEP